MRRLIYIVFPILLLAGCAGEYTPEQQMAVACRGYASTLSVLAPFKAKMTSEQVAAVDEARMVIKPACEAFSKGQPAENSVVAVRDALRQMLLVEQEMKK